MNMYVIDCERAEVSAIEGRTCVQVTLQGVKTVEIDALFEQVVKQGQVSDMLKNHLLAFMGRAECMRHFSIPEYRPPNLMRTNSCNLCRHGRSALQKVDDNRNYECTKHKYRFTERELETSTCADWEKR